MTSLSVVPARCSSTKKAFTLVELLVTITITAILLALVIAGGGKALEKSRESRCASQLRQIGHAIQSYVSDNDGELPRPTIKAAESGLGGDQMWSKQLGAYLPLRGSSATSPENEIFICPSARYTGVPNDEISRSYMGSAAMNYFSSPTVTGSATSGPARKMIMIKNLSQTILVVEGKQSGTGKSCTSTANWTQASADLEKSSPQETTLLDYRHGNGRMNFLFADGHVETRSFMERSKVLREQWEGRVFE